MGKSRQRRQARRARMIPGSTTTMAKLYERFRQSAESNGDRNIMSQDEFCQVVGPLMVEHADCSTGEVKIKSDKDIREACRKAGAGIPAEVFRDPSFMDMVAPMVHQLHAQQHVSCTCSFPLPQEEFWRIATPLVVEKWCKDGMARICEKEEIERRYQVLLAAGGTTTTTMTNPKNQPNTE